MPFQTAHVTRWTRGVILQGLPDAIPDDALRHATNVRLDTTLGAITTRPGWRQETTDTLGGDVIWLGKRFGAVVDETYAQCGEEVFRLNADWDGPVSLGATGPQQLSDANYVDGHGDNWKYLVTGTLAVKDNGTLTLPIGILPPTGLTVTVALAADVSTTIANMDAAAGWTGAGTASGPVAEATIKQTGTNSLTFTIDPGGLGSISRAVAALTLDILPGGDASVKLDDYIHLWVRIDRPDWVEYMQLDFDLDGTSFAENYYSARVPILTRFNLGRDQWSRIQIRKAEFARFGESSDDWGDVEGTRISFLVSPNAEAAVTFYVDDFKLRGGFGIEGDIRYTVTYRNSATGARGNPPLTGEAVRYTTAIRTDRQALVVTLTNVAQGGSQHPGDTQIDTMLLFRQGGNFTQAVLVTELPDTTTTYTDEIADSTLVAAALELLELDNDPPPSGSTRVLFGPDASGHLFLIVDGHRVYFSKPFEEGENRAENWPPTQYMLVGDGSQRAIAGLATDTEVFIWTEERTYQIIGAGEETYLPVAIPNSHECVARGAVCAGAGSVFFVAHDGIYEQRGLQQTKITEAIDPFFAGRTISGHTGLATDRSDIRLGYFAAAESDVVLMLYANSFLAVKRNLQTGQLSECFFGVSDTASLRSLFPDVERNRFYAGGNDGQVYLIEHPILVDDAGTPIAYRARTKSFDFGTPAAAKKIATVHVEGNTRNAAMTVTALYGREANTEVLGTMTTAATTTVGYFPTATPQTRRDDLAVEVSGNASALVTVARISCAYAQVPELYTYLDSDVLIFPEVTQLKYLEFDVLNPADCLVTVYYDGAPRDSRPLLVHPTEQVVRHYLPAGLKGYTLRVTVTSVVPFELYSCRAHLKPLGTGHGYRPQEVRFAPAP